MSFACLFLSGVALLAGEAPSSGTRMSLQNLRSLPSPTERGEWPTYRGDAAQTGRCLLPGKIKQPAVQWKQFVGKWCVLLDVQASPERDSFRASRKDGFIELPESKTLAPKFLSQHEKDWNTGAEFLDLAGDGKLVRVASSYNVKYAKFLPDAKGYQKFVMEDGMSVKNRPDGPRKPVAVGTLYRYDHGKEEVVWRTEPQEQCEIPLCAVADMDGDGKDDIAVSTWWRVMVFDGETGKKKDECRWHNGRNYGHFQVADLDGDGLPEAIVFADFMIHLDLLRNVKGKLQVEWQKPMEFTLFGKRKCLRTLPDAVVRVKGRAPMLVANIFNDTGDDKWHAMVWDAMSGNEIANLADRYCLGHADLDGSGSERLMLVRSAGKNIPPVSDIYLAEFADGKWQETPLPVKGSWLTHTPPMPVDRATIAADGLRTALVTESEGGKTFWLHAQGRVLGLRLRSGRIETSSELDVPSGLVSNVRCVSSDGKRVLLALEGAPWNAQRLLCRGLEGQAVSMNQSPPLPDVPIVARLQKGGPPLVITSYGAGEVAAVQASPPKVVWHRPGRMRSDAAEQHYYGAEAAELLNDGNREVIVAGQGANGEALLLGYDAGGRERLRHAFPRFSGGPPTWNSGGLTQWMAGPLLGDGKTQIYASLRRSVMHTDESVALDPVADKELWWQTDLEKRGCGGMAVAIAQSPSLRQAQGGEQGRTAGGGIIFGQYPDIFYVLDARTGKPLLVSRFPEKEIGGWTAYSHPILYDFNGDGALEVLMSGCTYTLALLTLDDKMIWHTPHLGGTTSQVGVRRNAGRVEIGAAMYYKGGFCCYAGKDGALLWTFKPARNVSTDIVTCDVDGDGEEEFIFGAGKTLYALGSKGNEAVVKWRLDLPQNVFSPICADADGDGDSEVLALSADGNVYCVGD
jgi:outer membrane protein assembly factor BamB